MKKYRQILSLTLTAALLFSLFPTFYCEDANRDNSVNLQDVILLVRDLAGSVREWCEDWFLENKYRLSRGGGWYSIHEGAFRAACRQGTNPAVRSSVIGFRVAAEPPRKRR